MIMWEWIHKYAAHQGQIETTEHEQVICYGQSCQLNTARNPFIVRLKNKMLLELFSIVQFIY